MARCSRPPGSAGFALLIVLWSLVLLSLLATQITAAGRSELLLAANLRAAARAAAAADGGIHEAVFHVLDAPDRRWLADGRPHAMRLGDEAVEIRIEDEAGKVNPNLAPQALLAALLAAVGADAGSASAIAASIVEWHFPGDVAARTQRYRAAGRALAPDGQPFRGIEDLAAVLGMTPALLARIAPHLSLYTDGQPDPARADPVVLAALRATGVAAVAAASVVPQPTAITVTASAHGADGGVFIRRAVVSLGPDRAGRLFRILAWDRGDPDDSVN